MSAADSANQSNDPKDTKKSPLLKVLKTVGRAILVGYSTLFLVGLFGCNSLIFLPPDGAYSDGPHILKIPVKDYKVAAQYYRNKNSPLTILYSHGNAENLKQARYAARNLTRLGFSVLIWDYGGYGLSGGEPTVDGTCAEIEAVYAYMVEQLKIPEDQIIFYGRSVGGGPTMHLVSTKPKAAGVILESTFVSAFRVAIPFPVLPFDRFPNRERIRDYKGPLLIMHGRKDKVVPFWHGEALFEAATTPLKQNLWIDNAGHNNFTAIAQSQYDQAVFGFAQEVFKSQGKSFNVRAKASQQKSENAAEAKPAQPKSNTTK